jgi:ELWxxDGT repeat protein
LAVVGNRLYFSADDGVHGSELWRSDGTAEQTALVRDLEQASASSLVLNYQGSIRGGERVFFNVYTGSEALSSRSFWLSDGTLSGTRVISESFQFYNAITINDRLVMQTEIPTRVWISDGTREGTVRLQSLTGSAFILNRAGNFVFMSEFSGSGFTIWSTDGTPQGTTRLFQANDVLRYIPTNTGLYALERGSDDSCLLRFTDGTLAGTRPPVPLPTNCNYSLQATSVNGLLYMLLRSDNSPQQSLWVSDGTSAGTGLIKELDYRDYYGLSATGTKLTFFARTYIESDRLFEFWASDGTAGGTSAIVSFPFFVEANLNYFGTTVTKRYFIVSLANGWQLWATDGTTAGTSVLLEGSFGLEDFSYPNWSEAIGDLLFFNGEDGEPWVSDGTPAGTYRLQDINPGAGRSQPFGFALAGRRLFFAADDGTHGAEPWVSEPSLRLVAPNALAAPDGQATLDLRVEELSLAAGSSVTLDVTLAEGVSYLGNEQNLTPVQEGNTLRFTWQVGAGALRLTPLTLRLALPANAPLGQAYPLGFKVSSSDPADNSADNQTTLEIRRVYQVVLPLVRS